MLRNSGEADSVDRRVAVQGEPAIQWMAGLGYDVTSDSPRMRAGGDVIRGRTFAVARLWHDASALTRRAVDGGSAISLVVEGRIRVTRGATSLEVSKGEGFVDTLDGATTVEVENSVGSIELRVSESFSRRYGVSLAEGVHWLGPDLDSLPWLLTLANATLASRGERRDTTWSFTRAALENLVAAVLVEANEPPSDSIVDRALEEIRRSCTDPSFDVAALAGTQRMTPRWLQVAFAERALTPRQAIRLERTRVARQILETHRGLGIDEVARRAGFPSSRALRDAFRALGEAASGDLLSLHRAHRVRRVGESSRNVDGRE